MTTPSRWGDEAPEALRREIEQYRERVESQRVEGLLGALEGRLDGPDGGGGSGDGSSAGGPEPSATETGATGTVGGLAGKAWPWLVGGAVATLIGGTLLWPSEHSDSKTGSAAAVVAPGPVAPGSAGPHQPGAVATPAPAGTAPAAQTETPAPSALPQAPANPERVSGTPPKRATPARSERAAAAPGGNPAVELELLSRARALVERDPAGCLTLLQRHSRHFPKGVFVQEREVLAVEALVEAGRVPDARRRAAAFKRSFPNSAHLRRLRTILAER